MSAFNEPWPPEDEAPLCKTRGCARLGIRAVRGGLCRDCWDAAAEDAAEAAAEAAREARRFGIGGITTFLLLAVTTGLMAGCATTRTPRGIALDFAQCFEDRTPAHTRLGSGWPLSARCQCIKDADRWCIQAGHETGCWRDGWNDADRDAWSVAACDDRERRGL